jgi:MFS transporter, FHS family, L-fucose permease
LNLAQGFNSFGHTIAPVIGGFLIFKFFLTEENPGANSVKIPYLIFGGAFILLAVFISFAHLPAFTGGEKIEKRPEALKHRNLFWGIFAVFFYVGAEVSIGSNMVAYLKLPDVAGLVNADASKYLAFYWGGAMIGRFMGSISLSETKGLKKYLSMAGVAIVLFIIVFVFSIITNDGFKAIFAGDGDKLKLLIDYFRVEFNMIWYFLIFLVINYFAFMLGKSLPARTLTIFALFVMSLLLIGIFTTGKVAMWSMLGIGLFNSIMWSNIFTLAISGLKKFTSQGSSLLVMMIVGGAILPLLQGFLADMTNVHYSLFVPFAAYFYLLFYGLKGYKRLKTED